MVCVFIVIVEDNENLIISCLVNVDVSCDSFIDIVNIGFVMVMDNCGEVRVEVLEEVVILGSCEDEFSIECIFIVID